MTTTTWIIAADSSRARILQVTDRQREFAEVEDLLNPEGRVHDRELISDAHPRFSGHAGNGPASDREETSAAEHATELFAKHLGAYLGQLRKELGKKVQKRVAAELPKDLSWLNTREIEQSLARRVQ
jgi:protein required for attachment to host cells